MIKIGTDICSIERITAAHERFGERFLQRILTEREIDYVLSSPAHLVTRLAGRFAAKEAASKVLGTGWVGIGWKEVEIVRLPSGEPTLHLTGRAAARASELGLSSFAVTVSHEREYAVAFVLGHNQPD